MHNLTTAKDLADILDRVDKLTPNSRAKWGKMTINMMLCHATDYHRMMVGDIPTKRRHSYLYQNFMKWWVMRLDKLPRSMPTVLEIDSSKGNGTPATYFENDKYLLKNVLLGFALLREKEMISHPQIGRAHV